ncbi:CBS domain-containing protein [Aliifodinibius salipaludis]|uniref:CBS domain-containing protein n=1 Tax=Fodinibius salipaludis TaxID=2032627 RepID=A0A2A2G7K4_9BACT|nr:CBS domain-containing protein [Aliifodinibius salipaludis]PAU92984.1 CBS domain-containing protein [Aliifodinibius salipaludis]
MLANKSITESDFEPLHGTDTVAAVKNRMKEVQVNALPVVDPTTQKLIGQIDRDQLSRAEDDQQISDLQMDKTVKIFEGQHIFEGVRLMLQYELNLLPLVNKEATFLGVITKQQVLEAISKMLNLEQQGSVLTIEIEPIDFSLSEIVQIIETEGAKILGVAVESPDSNHQAFEISVKLNLKDISRVTAALKRYGYSVLSESESTVLENDLEYRADELLKYIDM